MRQTGRAVRQAAAPIQAAPPGAERLPREDREGQSACGVVRDRDVEPRP